MILVTLGTQEIPFNRLLEEIDRLIANNVIQEKVFAQVGFSNYVPLHFEYQPFTTFQEFDALLDQSRIIITHGGTGTIVGGLKKNKKIIAVPRLKKYGEHVDDHQLEIIQLFDEKHLILGVNDVKDLEIAYRQIDEFEPAEFVSGNDKIVALIHDFISGCEKPLIKKRGVK